MPPVGQVNHLKMLQNSGGVNCIFASGRVSCHYFQYVNTLFRSLLSQDIENQQITSLKYTVITPRLRQYERNRAFGMLVAGTSVNELQVCFVAFVFLFITS